MKAAAALRSAEHRLVVALLNAHERGSSLRSLSLASGYSHEKVRKTIAAERERREAWQRQRLEENLRRLAETHGQRFVDDWLRRSPTSGTSDATGTREE